MKNDVDNYNMLLNELYKYYKSVREIFLQEFKEIKNHDILNIDFNNDFAISNKRQNGFIVYDYMTNKFNLSINCGLDKYNNLVKKILPKL